MATDWNEVHRVAAEYAQQWADSTYWRAETPSEPAWMEEKICEHCHNWFTSWRPEQKTCSRACRSARANALKYDHLIPAWKLAYASGMSMDGICEKWGVSKCTVHRLLTYHGIKPRDKRKFLKHAGNNY